MALMLRGGCPVRYVQVACGILLPMSYDTPTLGESSSSVVRFQCRACGRTEIFQKDALVAEYGERITLLKLLPLIAKCDQRDCRVRYYIHGHGVATPFELMPN
jgi:hypothetical protein